MKAKNQHDYTEQERIEHVRAYIQGSIGQEKYALQNNISRSSLERWVRKYKHLAELKNGYLPEGHDVKGVSVLYGADGEIKQQWVKSDRKKEDAIHALNLAVESLKKDIPRQKRILPPIDTDKDLMSCYVCTDYHFGMLAWGQETYDSDWDINIAEDLLLKWFQSAIMQAPKSHTGVFLQLGDMLHYDSLEAITPTGKHILDADSRFPKIVDIVIKTCRTIINMMLEKHEKVHIIMAEGNHDLSSSVWLRALFAEKYADDPRITVDNTHNPYYAFEWGDISLFAHHGHMAKVGNVSKVMAGMYRELYGKTKYSYVHTGHYHHRDVKEDNMMIVEQHPTLAAMDAYAARGGYLSQRSASVITYHKKFGEVSRVTVRPEMLY